VREGRRRDPRRARDPRRQAGDGYAEPARIAGRVPVPNEKLTLTPLIAR
jgi:hypothetical protein